MTATHQNGGEPIELLTRFTIVRGMAEGDTVLGDHVDVVDPYGCA